MLGLATVIFRAVYLGTIMRWILSCAMHTLVSPCERENVGLAVALLLLSVYCCKNSLLERVNIFKEINLKLSGHIVPNTRL